MKKPINPSELELLEEKVIKINRVAKVVTGGRRFSFSAVVAIGDGKGHVGVEMGKANEVLSAIAKGKEKAKKSLQKYPIINGTIPHEVYGKWGAAKVLLKPASPGTGIIACGPIRAIMEEVGIKDIFAKSIGSTNSINVVKATINALGKLNDPIMVARKREKTIREIFE